MNPDNSNPFKSMDFEQIFGGKMPFMPSDQMDSDWVQNYLQFVLKNAMMPFGNMTQDGLQTETTETDHYVIVKIRAPETVDPKHLRVLVSTSDMKLNGLPGKKEHVIKLPTLVYSTSGRAIVKEDHLEIKIRKQNADDSYHEVIMRYE